MGAGWPASEARQASRARPGGDTAHCGRARSNLVRPTGPTRDRYENWLRSWHRRRRGSMRRGSSRAHGRRRLRRRAPADDSRARRRAPRCLLHRGSWRNNRQSSGPPHPQEPSLLHRANLGCAARSPARAEPIRRYRRGPAVFACSRINGHWHEERNRCPAVLWDPWRRGRWSGRLPRTTPEAAT